jgi:hypothetical protein
MCPYELALKLHELGVNSESEFYFVKEMKGGGSKTESVTQNTMRYSYRKEGDLIPAYMSHELGEILPSMINISKSKIWDDWLQLTQYFPNKDSEYYEAAYVRYNAYDSPTEVYSGFDRNECEMLLDKNGSDDKMESFIIQMVFNKDDKIILDDIEYHKIGSIFKYNIDSKEVELEVVESSDASCEGCAFNNSKNYYCKDTHCIDIDRKDDIDVIYKKVKRS